MIVAKLALGALGTLTLAGAYVFHEGVIRVAVDEHKGGQNESHVHFFVPAAAVPLALHVVPEDRIRQAAERLRPCCLRSSLPAGSLGACRIRISSKSATPGNTCRSASAAG